MTKEEIIKKLRDMAKYPTVTMPRDTEALRNAADLLEQAQKAEPVAWPKTPYDISNMIGSSFVWREHKISDIETHEEDKYCVTAHDLLEAFERWSGYTSPPPLRPLTDEQLKKTWYDMKNIMGWYSFQEIARAIEVAHGIKVEA